VNTLIKTHQLDAAFECARDRSLRMLYNVKTDDWDTRCLEPETSPRSARSFHEDVITTLAKDFDDLGKGEPFWDFPFAAEAIAKLST